MKATIVYSGEDLLQLVVSDLKAKGYAVSAEDVALDTDVQAIITLDGAVFPPAPAPAAPLPPPPPPPPPSSASAGVGGAPPVAATARAPGRSTSTGWTSIPPGGQDPRFTPIEPPTRELRVPRVREVGHDTGLVQQLQMRGEITAEQVPPRASQAPEEQDDEVAGSFEDDFLDSYTSR